MSRKSSHMFSTALRLAFIIILHNLTTPDVFLTHLILHQIPDLYFEFREQPSP